MSISQEKIAELLSSWQTLSSGNRDKIIYEALFSPQPLIGVNENGDEYEIKESIPMFSDNIKQNEATESLVTKLSELGYNDIVIEKAPRSTLATVRCNGAAVPLMPVHKAIAFLAYIIAVSNSE